MGPREAARLRAARIGLTAVFAVDGAIFASWASRLPQVQKDVGAGTGALGLALAGTAAGALPAMVAMGWVCRRLRALRVACITVLVLCGTLLLPAQAGTPGHLAAALVVFGACYGGTDVAMNTAAVELAQQARRPIVPAFHAAYSAGALTGAGVGALAAGAHVDVRAHLAIAAAVGAAVVTALCAAPFRSAEWAAASRTGAPSRTPSRSHAEHAAPARAAIVGPVVVAATLTGSAAFAEGTVANWSGIHLLGAAHAAVWMAPLGYAAMSLAQAVVRSAGPRVVERLGARRVGTVGTLLAAGALALTLVPSTGPALLGYAVAGAALANLFPLGIAHGGAVAGSVGVSVASTVGYAGFLLGPPLVGGVAQGTSLTAALGLPVVLSAVASVAALRLPAASEDPALVAAGSPASP